MEEKDTSKVGFLKSYCLTKFCADAVGRWLKKLDFCTIYFQINITPTGMRRIMLFGKDIIL